MGVDGITMLAWWNNFVSHPSFFLWGFHSSWMHKLIKIKIDNNILYWTNHLFHVRAAKNLMASANASAPLALLGNTAAVTIVGHAYTEGFSAAGPRGLSSPTIHRMQHRIFHPATNLVQVADRGLNPTWICADLTAGTLDPANVPLCQRLGSGVFTNAMRHKNFGTNLFSGTRKQRIRLSSPPERPAKAPSMGIDTKCVWAPRPTLAIAQILTILDMDQSTASQKQVSFLN